MTLPQHTTTNTCGRVSRFIAASMMVGGALFVAAPLASAVAQPAVTQAQPAQVPKVQASKVQAPKAQAPQAITPQRLTIAQQQPVSRPAAPVASPTVKPVTAPKVANGSTTEPGVEVNINGVDGKPSSSLVMILGITALSVAPALLLMTTSFTKILVVLSITRNALGLTTAPPNQVLAGLALFLSIFIMGPTITQINDTAVQPYLNSNMTQSKAIEVGQKPLKTFMLKHTRNEDLALMTRAAKRDNPAKRENTPIMTVIPAFMLSELRAAFIIGFVVFVPFLVIDIVVSAILMAMGMMMLPPVTISLPFKLLLFVMVDGWGQVVTALVGSYR